MANPSTSKDTTLTCSVLHDDSLTNTDEEVVEWTPELELCLLFSMIGLKPCGINKHMNVLIIRDKINKTLNINISTKSIWKYLESKWDLEAADAIENTTFDTTSKDFVLPPEFDKLTLEERENIEKEKEKEKEKGQKCLNLERKSFSGQEKTISKVKLQTKKEKELDLSNKKKTLCTNNISDEINKIIDSKQSNKKLLNNSDLEKNEKPMVIGVQKRKFCNESESSIRSDSSKRISRCRTMIKSELTVSDRLSRSISPEIIRGRTSCRSVTPETISRKSNLRSNDKDQKSKFNLEKSNELAHNVNPVLPKIKTDKQSSSNTSVTESKSKHSIQNKNDLIKNNKGKIRGRITSDHLIVQQNLDCQPLGKRCCKKSI